MPGKQGIKEKYDLSTQILEFMRLSERLKNELRHSWLSGGRQESVADHCWHMGLLAILLHDHLDIKIDLQKTLVMVLVHDIGEAIVGDIPFTAPQKSRDEKYALELAAVEHIGSMLPTETGQSIQQLWLEFEEGKSNEAKFVKALDNLEAQIQHNIASLGTWEDKEFDLVYTKMDKYCTYDSFLSTFCEAVKDVAEREMINFGVSPETIKRRLS